MKYNTRDNRIKSPKEFNTGKRIVERAGYVSKEERIKKIMEAGQQLLAVRKEMYDFPPGTPVDEDIQPDPTRSGNFDLSDATIISMELLRRKIERDQKKAEDEKAREIALAEQKKAQEIASGASGKGSGE